jgi:hypothetical protein
LTADERVVLPPVTAEIFHPYSDMPEEGIEVLAYDYVEAFAEKFRALSGPATSTMSSTFTETPMRGLSGNSLSTYSAKSAHSRA